MVYALNCVNTHVCKSVFVSKLVLIKRCTIYCRDTQNTTVSKTAMSSNVCHHHRQFISGIYTDHPYVRFVI